MANRSSGSFPFLPVLVFVLLSLGSHGSDDGIKKLYIAYMGERHHEDPRVVASLHHETLSSVLGSTEEALGSIVYSYKHGLSGFAARLTDSQAKTLAGMEGVLGVKLSQTVWTSTTRSWDFLGLSYSNPPSELLHKAKLGEDVIIGIIDTGIWPESKSFDDSGYGPVPKRWKGICQTGEAFNASHCNRKIIGARWYAGDVSESVLQSEYRSARDLNSHGTHVASTAAGSFVADVSVGGLAAGWARGGAPRARLAVYKVLWGSRGQGTDAAVLAAIDDAIHDGVDIISLSLGGGMEESWTSSSLHAVRRGISIVYSAGNDGPYPQTVGNTSPWVITVAASTMDRSFPTAITLRDNVTLVGQAIYYGDSNSSGAFTDIVYGSSCDEGELSRREYSGRVVLCNPGPTSPTDDILSMESRIKSGGGRGLIFPQHTTNVLENFKGSFPSIAVDWVVFQRILDYIVISGDSAKVKLAPTRTVEGKSVLSPRVAAFSSRGPSKLFPGLLKPDITAPGVSVLAAVGDSYDFMSGTSMSAPEVSGIVALLKSLHPTWSPAALKSAIMTTASVVDKAGLSILAEGNPRKIADPFDYGSGQINPDKAADPGLIYDINPEDFDQFNCTSNGFVVCETPQLPVYHLNLPSISIPDLKTKVTVSRIVTNVGSAGSTYTAIVEPPPGVQMQVEPPKLVFDEQNKTQKFTITLTSAREGQGVYSFGSLTWKDATHTVRIPIAVRPVIQDFYADVA